MTEKYGIPSVEYQDSDEGTVLLQLHKELYSQEEDETEVWENPTNGFNSELTISLGVVTFGYLSLIVDDIPSEVKDPHFGGIWKLWEFKRVNMTATYKWQKR